MDTDLETIPGLAPAAPPRPSAGRSIALLATYTAAVFAGAFLLFLVQPLFGKLVLPLLGGSPAVWNSCMLFFQVALLVGYLYAHLGARWLEPRAQWMLHLGVLGLALLTLPIGVGSTAPDPTASPIPWLLGELSVSVGLPFVALAATGPMLQRWFARSGHPGAATPYHLYAASNLGSLLALLAYPLLVEPRLRLADQSAGWTVGFLLLGGLIAGCGAWGWSPRAAAEQVMEAATGLTVSERAWWVFLAFVPSSLLLGATTYITTDLTPAPLLWVIPLAIYLLTFTLTFASRPPIPHGWMLFLQPATLAGVVLVLSQSEHMGKPSVALPLHMTALFVTAMVCHGELARRRPEVAHLTEFYLWISLGGALGGVFNVLVAPLLFDGLWEYPVALVLACLARPWPRPHPSMRTEAWWGLRAGGFALVLVLLPLKADDDFPAAVLAILSTLVVYLVAVGLARTPFWLAVCVGTVVLAAYQREAANDRVLLAHRSFYGRYQVNRSEYGYTVLQHGSTLHGAQSTAPRQRRDPLTYYVREGPLGDVFTSMGISTDPWRVAVVGLGAGTTAAYASEGEEWTFFELDPGIERIARDPRFFSYLADSPARTRVVLGDARVSLGRDTASYDLLVLDAFSSDAIPTHLLTREAMETYLARLAPGGRIAIHISNRYLNLEPVVAALADTLGLAARTGSGPPKKMGYYENSSTWVAVARSDAELQGLTTLGEWRPARGERGVAAWTDDFSSLLSVMQW